MENKSKEFNEKLIALRNEIKDEIKKVILDYGKDIVFDDETLLYVYLYDDIEIVDNEVEKIIIKNQDIRFIIDGYEYCYEEVYTCDLNYFIYEQVLCIINADKEK